VRKGWKGERKKEYLETVEEGERRSSKNGMFVQVQLGGRKRGS